MECKWCRVSCIVRAVECVGDEEKQGRGSEAQERKGLDRRRCKRKALKGFESGLYVHQWSRPEQRGERREYPSWA